ncbi:hypothetical protein [Sphingomonas sp.]|uniref:hypothetical protein n=1 Tax=Sphingomonas sp. TaxID=28214 RepID=UPI0031D78ADE
MIRGWTAVIVFTTLAVVMMIGVNVRMWRRMKAATAAAKAEAGEPSASLSPNGGWDMSAAGEDVSR